MIVDTVSATPFALLRRAKNFEYRDSDDHLQEFANFDDPVTALTDECFRVLRCISSANESDASSAQTSTSLRDASWSRFEDIGFGGAIETGLDGGKPTIGGLSSVPHSSGGDFNRPTTPSWADFMSTGFSEESKGNAGPLLLPPDKVLPPIATDRGQSSQSNRQTLDSESTAEPGELASINTLELDDSFWWVWITSLAGEEPGPRKAVFGRCALIETAITNAKWLVFEEQIKGAAPEPKQGTYVMEKKRRFGFGSRRGKLTRRKSSTKKMPPMQEEPRRVPQSQSKTNIAPDQHARIQAAAAALQKKHQEQEANGSEFDARGDAYSTKTNSVLTLQPSIMTEASQAMKWTTAYDKDAYRKAYLGDTRAGTGTPSSLMRLPSHDKPASPTTTKQAPVQADAPSPPKQEQAEISKDPEPKSEPAPEPAAAASPEPMPPVDTPEPVEPELKKSVSPEDKKSSSPEDSTKKLRKKPGATGFKSMFGTGKKKEGKEQPPMKPTGAERSAVAAARAALEGKAKAAQEQSRPTTNGSSVLKKKSIVESAPESAEPEPEHEHEHEHEPEPTEKPATPGTNDTPEKTEIDHPVEKVPSTQGPPSGVPKAYRDTDTDAISSVDTNERAAADAEFSRFDQGPLDQPAFVPEDSPISETTPDKPSSPVQPETKPETKSSSPETNSSHDRWAQIRKNAADRVAAGESGHRSMDTERTDEGDTSGEESESLNRPLNTTNFQTSSPAWRESKPELPN